MEVSGDKAQILSQGLIKIANLRMTFYEEGKTVMHVTTPLCFFDRIKRTAASTADVCVTRSEIIVTGRDFNWNEKDGRISINKNTRVILPKAGHPSAIGDRSAEVAPGSKPAGFGADTNSTVITSTRLTYDQKKSRAVFEGKVVVTDPALKIGSDCLTVLFSNDKKVESIEAEGNVVINRNEIWAAARTATYNVRDGKIVLSGKPSVTRQRNNLTAETIVFWRDSNKILCEPNAHLIIYSEQDMKSD